MVSEVESVRAQVNNALAPVGRNNLIRLAESDPNRWMPKELRGLSKRNRAHALRGEPLELIGINLPAVEGRGIYASQTNDITAAPSTTVTNPHLYIPPGSQNFTTVMPKLMKDTDLMPSVQGTTSLNGIFYVPSWLPQYSFTSWLYLNEEITARKIYNLLEHWLLRSVLMQQMNMIFSETQDQKIRIGVVNERGRVDDVASEIQHRLHQMLFMNPRVDIPRKMRLSHHDIFGYGMFTSTWLWKRHGNEICLDALVRLPAQSFDYPPIGQPLVFSPILQGITLARDPATGLNTGEMQFWQRQSIFNFYPMLLESKNLFWIRDPVGTELAGDPICRPIISLCEMATYSMNMHMGYLNRKGKPWFFIKVIDPQGPCEANGYVDDISYANTILQYVGSDNRYVLRPNMTVETVNFNDTSGQESAGLATVQALHEMIVDYFSPKSAVTQNKGASLGNNTKGATDLFQIYIQAMRAYYSREWSRVPQYYIEANGYEGYTGTILFPTYDAETAQIRVQQALAAAEIGIGDPLQILDKLDFEVDIPLDASGGDSSDNWLIEKAKLWGRIKAAMGGPAPSGAPGGAQFPPLPQPKAQSAMLNSILKQQRLEDKIADETAVELERLRNKLLENLKDAIS